MPDVNIKITVECRECGHTLDAVVGANRYGTVEVSASPCETCMNNAKEGGECAGYDRGCEEIRKETEDDARPNRRP